MLFFTIVFWNSFLGTAMSWLDWEGETIGIVLGISMVCIAWAVAKTSHGGIAPVWYVAGSATLLCSWWCLVEGTAWELSYLGINAFLIYLSIRVAIRALLVVSIIGLLSFLAYFAWEYFADVIGWPICLIVTGLLMMGVSAWAVKLGRTISPAGTR